MSTMDPRKVIQDYQEAINKKDLDKAMSLVADDVIAVVPEGTLKGKAANRRYFEWVLKVPAENKITDNRFVETAIYAQGNVVTFEYSVEGTTKKGKMSVPAVAVAEIKDGKLFRVHNYYDRLAMAKQMASGVVATRTINAVISQMEKGLR